MVGDGDEDDANNDSAQELFKSAILAVSRMVGLLGNKFKAWCFSDLVASIFDLGLVGVKLIEGGSSGTAVGNVERFERLLIKVILQDLELLVEVLLTS